MGFQLMTALEQRRFLSVSAHLRVLNNETTIEAGQSVHVSAMPNRKGAGTNFGGDPTAAQIEWNFHDPQGSYNHLPGFNAAHVYERPGKYKITLRVTNKGETDTASRIIKVVAPQRKRVYVNPWGNDNNNGKTPGKAVATIDRAMQLVGNNTELLFRSGMKFNVGTPISLPFSNVVVGAYGKGKTPKLVLKPNGNQFKPMFVLSNSSHQVSIENLLLESNGAQPFGDAIHAGGSNVVIKGCDFENLDSAIVDSGSPAGLVAYNNYAGPLRSYFAYVKGSDQAFLGNIVKNSTKQHNIRIYASRVLAYGNDLTNLPDGASLATLRVNDGSDIYWSNNNLHGGQIYVGPLGPESAGSTPTQHVDTVVIENNRWTEVKKHWSSNDRLAIHAGTSNVTVRDNYFQATNSSAVNVSTFMHEKFGKKYYDRSVTNLNLISNTAVNSGTQGAFLSVGGGQQHAITLKDSTYVAPDMHIGPNANAAVRVTGRDDLANFTSLSSGGGIDGNTWNLPAGAKSIGVNYVSAKPAGNSAYRTPAEWTSDFSGVVGKDKFKKLLARDVKVL
jgi:PKD domain-containing protein